MNSTKPDIERQLDGALKSAPFLPREIAACAASRIWRGDGVTFIDPTAPSRR